MRLPRVGFLHKRAACKQVLTTTASSKLNPPAAVDQRAVNSNGNNGRAGGLRNGNGNGRGNRKENNGKGNGNGGNKWDETSSAAGRTRPATTSVAAVSTYTPAATPETSSKNGAGGAAVTPANGVTSAITATRDSIPTEAAGENGSSQNSSSNPPPVAVQQSTTDPASGPRPTAGANSGPSPAVADGTQTPATTQKWSSPTLLAGITPGATASSALTSDGVSSTNRGGLSGAEGASYGSGTIGKGTAADGGWNSEGSGSGSGSSGDKNSSLDGSLHSDSIPKIVGSLVGKSLSHTSFVRLSPVHVCTDPVPSRSCPSPMPPGFADIQVPLSGARPALPRQIHPHQAGALQPA